MKLRLLKSQSETADVYSFRFLPQEPIAWIAGQSIRLELEAGYSTEERRFSISSAPAEGYVQITTRQSESEFKQALFALTPGDEIDAFAIEGNFVWEEKAKQKLFYAQGVGITPVRSILTQLDTEGSAIEAVVVYAANNRDFLFKKELERFADQHPGLKVHFLSQQLSLVEIQKHIPSRDTVAYLSGSSTTVDMLTSQLLKAGMHPQMIRQDWFTGLKDETPQSSTDS